MENPGLDVAWPLAGEAHPGHREPSWWEHYCIVHILVYDKHVKRWELERQLRDLGWTLQRHGRKHDVWVNQDESFTE